MQISRMTVDKLGVKLYDRVYAVIAELISNSYDADAENVTIRAPMGQYLATKTDGKVASKNVSIEIEDDGSGMSPDQLQEFYLVVGAERRNDPKRGDVSPKFRRKVMGRKGVGKLAPFGICQMVEIVSAGGAKVRDGDQEGYRVAHIVLDKNGILDDTPQLYQPTTGDRDGTLSPKTFTKVTLREFNYRRLGTMSELSRQLSQRFGLPSENWRVTLEDTSKTSGHPDYSIVLGAFEVPVMANSKVTFSGPKPTEARATADGYRSLNPDGTENPRTPSRIRAQRAFLSDRGLGRLRQGSLQGRVDGWRSYLLSRQVRRPNHRIQPGSRLYGGAQRPQLPRGGDPRRLARRGRRSHPDRPTGHPVVARTRHGFPRLGTKGDLAHRANHPRPDAPSHGSAIYGGWRRREESARSISAGWAEGIAL